MDTTGKKFAPDYAKDFTAKHPEVGEVLTGSKLSGDALRSMSGVVGARLREIQQAGILNDIERTSRERQFVRTSADMVLRTLLDVTDRNPRAFNNPTVHEHMREIINKAYGSARGEKARIGREINEERFRPDESGAYGMTQLEAAQSVIHDASVQDNERFAIHGHNMVDVAIAGMNGLAAIADQEGGELTISQYSAGNLQNMLAEYELATPKQAV